MDARVRSALLWGAIGALAFGVLAQGYNLLYGGITAPVLVGVALAVGVVATAVAYAGEGRLHQNERA